jgi:hypothetical protein
MTFIKTQNTITLKAKSGEIYKITPVKGVVHIEIEQYNEMNDTLVENWRNEEGFAKPEWQRMQDWTPEEDEEFEILENEIQAKKVSRPTDDCNWPLP